MREIKFRCWDKKSKKIRQVTEIVFNTGFYLEPNDNSVKLIWVKGQDIIENKEIQIQRQDDYILMQYTGLHDKNGKEIYEGDIVQEVYFNKKIDEKERRYGKYIVRYDKDRAGFVPFACGDGCGCCEDEVISVENAEIIGNIYDNPELLEKGEVTDE